MNKLGNAEGGVYECQKDELWVPGMWLNSEYPEATPDTLKDAWQFYSGGEAVPLQDVLGVYTPRDDVRAIASIDVCEVLRDTVVSIDRASNIVHHETGLEIGRRADYSGTTWYSAEAAGLPYERATIQSIAQVLMNEDLITPVDEIEDIARILQEWRRNGIMTVANTSTLPGCELATVTKYFAKHLPGAFDGIVFPRNHDGTGKITKAMAIEILATEADLPHRTLPLIHIDDVVHHVEGFMTHYADHDGHATFLPLHGDNAHAPADTHCQSPLDAFEKAHLHFEQRGVL